VTDSQQALLFPNLFLVLYVVYMELEHLWVGLYQ